MRDTRRKTSQSRGENQQKTHDPRRRLGFEPGPHSWVRARSHHCARTLALYKQKNDGLL